MKRIIMMFLRNFWYVPGAWIRLCWYAAHPERYSEEKLYAFLQDIDRHANRGGNIILDAHGVENIPKESGFMLFPNHQGMYDVLALIETCPVPLSVVAKKEVGNVPGLKQIFRCIRAFLIDREDLRQSMRVIQDVAKEVSSGRNYVIFPEGTRSRQGNHLQEFKGGSFKAATKSKCPIVPVALIDAYKAFDTGSIRKLTVQVHYLPPMYYEEYKDMKTVQIAEEVKRRIEQTIAEYAKEA
ncbi:MAG: 1-acyl-sn-glycerol-3-phosphate acyltransferase [Blautia sp.]|nr:1-acyl-sn-glycerol-3-phosphate acyltransferase [Blautia sp.]